MIEVLGLTKQYPGGEGVSDLTFFVAPGEVFVFLGPNDGFALETASLLGLLSLDAPRWISWALGDLLVKILCGIVLLLPYGALMSVIKPMPAAKATA